MIPGDARHTGTGVPVALRQPALAPRRGGARIAGRDPRPRRLDRALRLAPLALRVADAPRAAAYFARSPRRYDHCRYSGLSLARARGARRAHRGASLRSAAIRGDTALSRRPHGDLPDLRGRELRGPAR